jgi:hypothetical protein
MGNFERGFYRGMEKSIPAGVDLFTRLQAQAAGEKRLSKQEERQAVQDARQVKQDELSALESNMKYGGYNPAILSKAASQRALLSDADLSNLQNAMTKGQTGIPSIFAGKKYDIPAEQAMQGYEKYREDERKNLSFDERQYLIKMRGEESRATKETPSGGKKMPDFGAAVTPLETGSGGSWIKSVFGGKEELPPLSKQDEAALKWAEANPKDARALVIKKRLGR